MIQTNSVMTWPRRVDAATPRREDHDRGQHQDRGHHDRIADETGGERLHVPFGVEKRGQHPSDRQDGRHNG